MAIAAAVVEHTPVFTPIALFGASSNPWQDVEKHGEAHGAAGSGEGK
jgi:hypothetical protein